jgi:hypothetical protein
MLPFGPRLNTVFASRWKALLWAAGVLLTAYCTVPSPEDHTTSASSSATTSSATSSSAAAPSPWSQ